MARQEQARVSIGPGYEEARARAFGKALRPFRSGRTEWSLWLIDGPNMDNISPTGRDMRTYGTLASLQQLHEIMSAMARGLGTRMNTFTSDHEGEIVRHIYENRWQDGGLFSQPSRVNPAGLNPE